MRGGTLPSLFNRLSGSDCYQPAVLRIVTAAGTVFATAERSTSSVRNMPSDATEGEIATPATAGDPLGRRRCLDWGLPTMTRPECRTVDRQPSISFVDATGRNPQHLGGCGPSSSGLECLRTGTGKSVPHQRGRAYRAGTTDQIEVRVAF